MNAFDHDLIYFNDFFPPFFSGEGAADYDYAHEVGEQTALNVFLMKCSTHIYGSPYGITEKSDFPKTYFIMLKGNSGIF